MSLALWRRFAYDHHGKAIRGFRFSAEVVTTAQRELEHLVRDAHVRGDSVP